MKSFFICIIKFYQKNISPNTPSICKYSPTCSSYALEAIDRFGAFKGILLALYRFLRCNPLSKGGYDPVPQKKN